MSEEKIKLSLDYGSSAKDTVDISGKLDLLKTAAKNVGGDAFGELVTKSIEVAKKFREISSAASEAGTESKGGLSALKESGKGLFEAFGESNVGGMIKGVTGIVALIPALAPFAGAITAAGAAADTAWPLLKEWYEYLAKANEKMVESTKDIGEYVNKLKEANTELKNTEGLKKLKEEDALQTPGAKQKDRAESFEQLLKGRGQQALKDITGAIDPDADTREKRLEDIETKLRARLKEIEQRGVSQPEPVNRAFRAQATSEAKEAMAKVGDNTKAQGEAEALLAKARAGDAGAIERLMAILPKGSTTREIARLSSPEQQDLDRQAKRDSAEAKTRFEEDQRRAKEGAAARGQVGAGIRQLNDAKVGEIPAQASAESRGAAHAEKTREEAERAFQERVDETRRMSNQVQKGRKSSAEHERAPKLGQVPDNASERQAAMIMAGNQIGISEQIRQDWAEITRLANEARRSIAKGRSNASAGAQ